MVSLELLFVLTCSRTKTGAKGTGLWPDQIFCDYAQKFSDLQTEFKNQPQNYSRVEDLYSLCEIWQK
jgi:hypothetical protein